METQRPNPFADVPLKLAGHEFTSRLLVGTGKYATFELMEQALDASGCEVVTVALRRVDLDKAPGGDPLISRLDPARVVIVPNTSGARTAEEAAKAMKITAQDLLKMKIVDRIVPEPAGGAHSDRAAMMATLGDVIAEELDALEGLSPQALKAKRAERFYAIGRLEKGA